MLAGSIRFNTGSKIVAPLFIRKDRQMTALRNVENSALPFDPIDIVARQLWANTNGGVII
jgi:hypothetical protein